ncbi:hypothetical protein HMPREF0201_01902 [Cedecea davisae DSM 4568]|uniref:Uncharacterized protein n=1 Tax=Cedecea davisae DSM 4568 TaxID=566551 RepID=S3IX70_9ENTR|nr:hypothetical protein HMPREF0201_01902 [Cedecea davisae DSM 4568]
MFCNGRKAGIVVTSPAQKHCLPVINIIYAGSATVLFTQYPAAMLKLHVVLNLAAPPLFPALIVPGYDPIQAGWSCREQRKRAIVGNGA